MERKKEGKTFLTISKIPLRNKDLIQLSRLWPENQANLSLASLLEIVKRFLLDQQTDIDMNGKVRGGIRSRNEA